MLSALIKGIRQLSDPKAQKVVWMGIGAALLTFAVMWAVIGEVLAKTAIFETPWLEGIADLLGGAITLVLTWLLFPSVISAVIGLMLERIAQAVEARHYPNLPAANDPPLTEALIGAAKFLGVMVVLNLMLLPFLFFGPLFPIVFYGVNGYLLGREFFELVSHRRLAPAEARTLRKQRLFNDAAHHQPADPGRRHRLHAALVRGMARRSGHGPRHDLRDNWKGNPPCSARRSPTAPPKTRPNPAPPPCPRPTAATTRTRAPRRR
jgi:CysZ protein